MQARKDQEAQDDWAKMQMDKRKPIAELPNADVIQQKVEMGAPALKSVAQRIESMEVGGHFWCMGRTCLNTLD